MSIPATETDPLGHASRVVLQGQAGGKRRQQDAAELFAALDAEATEDKEVEETL